MVMRRTERHRNVIPHTKSGIAAGEEKFPDTGSIMMSPMMKLQVEKRKTTERTLMNIALVFFDILAMANIAFITILIIFFSICLLRKRYLTVSILFASGAPDGSQTHGPRLRRPVLYPLSYGRSGMALPKGFEPLAYRLGGGRSIRAELREQRKDYSTIFHFVS